MKKVFVSGIKEDTEALAAFGGRDSVGKIVIQKYPPVNGHSGEGGKPHLSQRWLVLHPTKEAKVVLETSAVVVEVGFGGNDNFGRGGNLSGRAVVAVDMVAVGMAIVDLVMMVVMEEAALVTLQEAEAREVVDRVVESRAVAMAGVAAVTAVTVEEVEAALAVG
ncbi:hypothetical protein QTO34_015296 [Cnephaeus nilssonii]|uniref:Uncharacterized protein n=1 Tax=Cnephaeus nilssonii TaxID=3371016 RepID=A0AA40I4K3_CNENI|nr:hypothetical protein QTO34_015296 [Eptesicus nilssonii]